MSHFDFLKAEFQNLHEGAVQTELFALNDPRTACFHARRTLELTVDWLYAHDTALNRPYQDQLNALIHEPTFRTLLGSALFNKARLVKDLGNLAVHSNKPTRPVDAIVAVRELFHILFWVARTYSRAARPPDTLSFDQNLLPKPAVGAPPPQTADQLQKLEAQLASARSDRAKVDEELAQVRQELAKAKAANAARPDTHNYSEAQTRDAFIDVLLKEAGWSLSEERDREFPVQGMPNDSGDGFVDYVLWSADGLPLGLVEAKRTRRNAVVGEQQAKLYADCLEKAFGCRPLIFLSNGYEHWFWDDTRSPKREVQGFYTRDELALAVQRRTTRKPLASVPINEAIVERYYQERAVRRVAESFERDNLRKALLVMATGAGKTRTVIALTDLLMRANWVKRVLFLADRVALVKQAINAFKTHLPDSTTVNLVTDRDEEGRIYVSTYPTMMGLIDRVDEGKRRFGVGHFDLVIIDEAHRSVFQKYKAIFDYFDSLLVGLTATPVDEIHRNTYSLFELENGVPTDAYDLSHAVRDGFLVPMKAVTARLKFPSDGIRYDQLSAEEQEEWDEKDWPDDGSGTPLQHVESEAVNRWLFNKDTVDKVLEHLMTRGQMVGGGDELGKTIIFAKNQDHADFIAQRFDANYPKYKGEFARVITFRTEYAQSLIDNFSNKQKRPQLAISVDMLDTGIDVPEVVNLVFFKLVRSRTKFWQMLGRGTRLCRDLFGPDQHKRFFYVFDYCGNFEFFSQNPEKVEGSDNASLSKRIFTSRLELMTYLENEPVPTPEGAEPSRPLPTEFPTPNALLGDVKSMLAGEVAAMNVDNFIVRPQRKLVEKFSALDAWKQVDEGARHELANKVAGLPTELESEPEEAKRFDLLILRTQLAVLKSQKSFARYRDQVVSLAEALIEMSSIPMVKAQLPLIEELLSDPWWQDVTVPMLEVVRRRLRLLVPLIDKEKRAPVYTDFEDELGPEAEVQLAELSGSDTFERFRLKAQAFLREHKDMLAVHKLRTNTPLTRVDLEQLESVLTKSGVGAQEFVQKAASESHGLGLFVRSLIGLDREAAKAAFAGFLVGQSLSANQIEFVNLIVDHLTENGVMETGRLYEAPFTDLTPQGPDALFSQAQVEALIEVLAKVKAAAEAA